MCANQYIRTAKNIVYFGDVFVIIGIILVPVG